jgi:cutinase
VDRLFFAIVSFAAATGIATALAAAPSVQAATSEPRAACSDVLVLGARGSGQPQAGSAKDGGTGLGAEVFSVAERIRTDLPGKTVAVRSLHYPARQAELIVLDPAGYFSGLERGVANAKKTLSAQVKSCPDQRLVLAGYSQGAMVMHRVLQDLSASSTATSRRVLSHIDGAVLLADGDRMSRDHMTSLGTAGAGRGVSYTSPQDSRVRGTLLPPRLASRVVSVCEQADIICDYRSLLQTNAAGVDGTTVHVRSYAGSPNVLSATDQVAARIR